MSEISFPVLRETNSKEKNRLNSSILPICHGNPWQGKAHNFSCLKYLKEDMMMAILTVSTSKLSSNDINHDWVWPLVYCRQQFNNYLPDVRFISPSVIFPVLMWSYASHRAQCGVTTSYSTCCGCRFRDYYINFRLFALSSPSMLTLCLKDPRRGVDTNQPDLLLTVR